MNKPRESRIIGVPTSAPPAYSGKYFTSGTRGNFSWKTSFLLRNRMIEVLKNHRELTTPSKSAKDSFIRFCNPTFTSAGIGEFGFCTGKKSTLPVVVPRVEPDHTRSMQRKILSTLQIRSSGSIFSVLTAGRRRRTC